MKLKMPSGEVVEVDEPTDLSLFITRMEDTIDRIRTDIKFAKQKAKQLGAWPQPETAEGGAK